MRGYRKANHGVLGEDLRIGGQRVDNDWCSRTGRIATGEALQRIKRCNNSMVNERENAGNKVQFNTCAPQ